MNETAQNATREFNKAVEELYDVDIWVPDDEDHEDTPEEAARRDMQIAHKDYLRAKLRWMGARLIEQAYGQIEVESKN